MSDISRITVNESSYLLKDSEARGVLDGLSRVAMTGSYDDLLDQPVFAIGSVTTLADGELATASIEKTGNVYEILLGIPKGRTGNGLKVDAIGRLSERGTYDYEHPGFVYVDTETGQIYIKQSEFAGRWAGPFDFRGLQGEKGDTGLKGDKGDAGDTGPKGDKGDTGDTGPKGDPGASVIVKASISLCVEQNDAYVDENGHLQVFDAGSGSFTDIGQFMGPEGRKGDQGVPGPKGDKGDKGEPGANAPYLIMQYSTDGISWHLEYDEEDCYIRFSVNGGISYTDGMKFVNFGVSPMTRVVTLEGDHVIVRPGRAYKWAVPDGDVELEIAGGANDMIGDSMITLVMGNSHIIGLGGLELADSFSSNAIIMACIRWTGMGAGAIMYNLFEQ